MADRQGRTAQENQQAQFVVFDLAAEEYAIAVQLVESIIKPSEPTKVPGAPHYVRGVVNLRGKIIPVVDLRSRFEMEPLEDESHTRVLVVELPDTTVGFLVDAVSEVLAIDEDAVEAAPAELQVGNSGVEGLVKIGDDRLIIVLDVEIVLGDADLIGTSEPSPEPTLTGAST